MSLLVLYFSFLLYTDVSIFVLEQHMYAIHWIPQTNRVSQLCRFLFFFLAHIVLPSWRSVSSPHYPSPPIFEYWLSDALFALILIYLVFPTRFKATAHGISAAAGKCGAIISALAFNTLSKKIGTPACLWSAYSILCFPHPVPTLNCYALYWRTQFSLFPV